VSRRAGVWTRLIRHTLKLSEPAWTVPVLFRIPVDANAVWAFYRSGDTAALLAALGPAPQHPQCAIGAPGSAGRTQPALSPGVAAAPASAPRRCRPKLAACSRADR
jgi:hypothetical protein